MRKTIGMTLILLALATQLAGCTIIRYVDRPEPEPPGPPPPPQEVDVLVLVELDRTTVSLAEGYQGILTSLTAGLAANNIIPRKLALAPMYRRSGEAVPLIYGLGDPDPEFEDYASAIAFFALDDGQRYLRDEVDADGENLATLGLDIGTRPIYHPTLADTQATPYFTDKGDGFIVVQLTAKARECAYEEASCQLDGKPAAEYFAQEGEGGASWLALAGGESYSKDKTFFINIATREGVDDETFVRGCENKPGFNQSYLDFMEPSANAYYEPLSKELNRLDVWSQYVDICEAMSQVQSIPKFTTIGKDIAAQLGPSE